MRVTVYTKPGCLLCEEALDLLDRLTPEYNLQVKEVNILDDMALYDAYHEKIPVIQAWDGRFGRLVPPITEAELRLYLEIARRMPTSGRSAIVQAGREPLLDRVASYIGRHWLLLSSIALALFVGLAWATSIFAALGWWAVADPLYTAYALTCHQLPERSGSLFGYQVAFCYRNTAIYGGLLGFGILYGLARDHDIKWLRWLRKSLPWWAAVLFVAPMAVDGFSHMFGWRDFIMDMNTDAQFGSFWVGSQLLSFNWWMRILTGALAAFGVVWFAYPRMGKVAEESEAMKLMYREALSSYNPQAASRRVTPKVPS